MNKQISLTAVKLTALLQIELNGSTTTLDVKNHLRSLDCFARQDQVSELLQQAADELPLEFTTNGQYRTYTLPDPSNVATQTTNGGANAAGVAIMPSSQYTYTKRDGTEIAGFKNANLLAEGDWIVHARDSDDDDDSIFFGKEYDRSDVRQAYANLTGTKFWDVRARRF